MTDRMQHCSRCGHKYDPYEDAFCANCGTAFRRTRQPIRSFDSWLILIILVIVIFSITSPYTYKLLFGDCGALYVFRTIRDLDDYSEHLSQLEDAVINNKRPPSYLLAQIDSDMQMMSSNKYDSCILDASQAMLKALGFSSIYFTSLPEHEMSDVDLEREYRSYLSQRRWDYESALGDYYNEINKLKSCLPFCNIDTLFENGLEHSLQIQQALKPPTQSPYVIVRRTSEDNPIDVDAKTRAALNTWFVTSAPVDTPYWAITYLDYRKDGTVFISLIGLHLSSPNEKWTLVDDVNHTDKIMWIGSVEVSGNSVKLFTP